MTQLWVGNTEFWENEDRLLNIVRMLTKITPKSCWFARDRSNNRLQNYGFLDFATKEEAAEVLRMLKGKPVPDSPGVCFYLKWGSNKTSHHSSNTNFSPASNSMHIQTQQNAHSGQDQSGMKQDGYSCYVGNLPLSVNDSKLLELFKRYFPSVQKAKVIYMNRVSKGYGFVKFGSHEEVLEAIRTLNNTPAFGEKPIKVSEASQNYIKTGGDLLESNNTTLSLSDIDYSVVDEDVLLKHFRGYGNVVSVRIEPCHRSWATVVMETHSAAESAKNALQGSQFGGSTKVLINWGKVADDDSKKNVNAAIFTPPMPKPQDISAFVTEDNIDKIVDAMQNYAEQQRTNPILCSNHLEYNKRVSRNCVSTNKLFATKLISDHLQKTKYWFY